MGVREGRLREISGRLGEDKLVWLGVRGSDAWSLLPIAQFAEAYSLVAALRDARIREVTLEELSGVRMDPDTYSLRADPSSAAAQFRELLHATLQNGVTVLPYRPTTFFPQKRYSGARFLGVFPGDDCKEQLEYKPWVEQSLAERGVPTLPWQYFDDYTRDNLFVRVDEILRQSRAAVVRRGRTSGGEGLALVRDRRDLEGALARLTGEIAVAPFLHPSVPLNVNACVFPSGEVALHAPSVQLIGLPEATRRAFGFCGNDFAAVADLPKGVLDELETIVRDTGRWLAQQNYVGAFGVDAVLFEGRVHFCEVNPRFQGSSRLAAEIDLALGRPDMFSNHISAFLEMAPPPQTTLVCLARAQPHLSQVIVHQTASAPRPDDLLARQPRRVDLAPPRGVVVREEASLFRAVFEGAVTRDGYRLDPTARVVHSPPPSNAPLRSAWGSSP